MIARWAVAGRAYLVKDVGVRIWLRHEPASGWLALSTGDRIRVGRATDPERFLAINHTVWFAEVPAAPTEEQLIGFPEECRFAADVDGSDPGAYPGVYGVFPLTLSIPGPEAGAGQVSCAGLFGLACILIIGGRACSR